MKKYVNFCMHYRWWWENLFYLILTIIVWNLAANRPSSSAPTFQTSCFLIMELAWAGSCLVFLRKWDVRLTIILTGSAVLLALLSRLPGILIWATMFYAVVSVALRVPRLALHNQYGLFCFALINAVIPAASLNLLTSQYLERSTLLNIGILLTLYFLFYALRFTNELAHPSNVLFIFWFAGLILANFPLLKDSLLIALVLLAYGGQIFLRNERQRICLLAFFVIALIAFIN
ncbi:hypothetical protein M8332_04170 [Fructilactobacillus ixorae]|uniref:Uncharacterized protein n=1 Tax=Fructilactobacillus ixorae TaxID=1750535 RepID=A0ABY5C457_9LACO|nr:hypothetical protein [Fructilactobacillus ixorae]USS92834.1 hypothetical protein M8332_04170 [Fructilactobacillus ixorae]